MKLKHCHGITKIKVEYLIAFDSVQGGKCVWREQIKNRCAEVSVAGVSGRQTGMSKFFPAAMSLDIKAALVRQRLHSKELNYLLCGGHVKVFQNLGKLFSLRIITCNVTMSRQVFASRRAAFCGSFG